jgi:4-hydroxy-4-methyl-2-oxoglutarate aldolase
VVDGVIRDVLAIKQLNFPVFCRGTTTAASGKYGAGELNVAISCGGVAIQPGDLIMGDADGVVVVPQASAAAIIKRAAEKLAKDEARAAEYSGNPAMVRKYLAENN